MASMVKIARLAKKIAEYLLYYGFDLDFLRDEVGSSSFLDDLYAELEMDSQEDIDTLYSELIEEVAQYLNVDLPEPSGDYAGHEYEVPPEKVEKFAKDKVRDKAKAIMLTPEFNAYIDEMEAEQEEDEE